MKTKLLNHSFAGAAFAGAILLLAVIFNAQAQYNYTSLYAPNSTGTYALGISGTNIVGYYTYAGNDYGFLYNGSSYINLGMNTNAAGISGTNIVGSAMGQGFLYNGGTYTTFSVPGSDSTYAEGISGANIVGWYNDMSYNSHGYIYNYVSSNFTYLNVSGAAETYACGISGTNIVGYTTAADGENVQSFLYNGISTNIFTVPGAIDTYACGISGTNIVGYYNGSDYVAHGFLYNGISYYTNLNYPGADFTEALGISGNNIVGFYSDTSAMYARGFLATPAALAAPPPLRIAGAQKSAGLVSLNLTWTNNGSQCLVASAGALTGGWNTVSTPWTTNSGWVSTIVTNSSTAQFYRLETP
jgi:hypothetical protein